MCSKISRAILSHNLGGSMCPMFGITTNLELGIASERVTPWSSGSRGSRSPLNEAIRGKDAWKRGSDLADKKTLALTPLQDYVVLLLEAHKQTQTASAAREMWEAGKSFYSAPGNRLDVDMDGTMGLRKLFNQADAEARNR